MPAFHNDATLPTPTFPGSHVVIDADYVHLSGLTAADIQGGDTVLGDIAEETRWVMRRIVHILESVDCTTQDAVRVDVHLTDLGEIEALDEAYAGFFTAPDYPARTCTETPRLLGGANVEITLMARRPKSENEHQGREAPADDEGNDD